MVVIPFALFVWWFFGKRRQALITGAFAVAAMAVSFGLLIPHFSPTGELLYAYRYADLGQGVVGIASGLVIHPEVLVGALADPARIGYLAVVLLPIPLTLLSRERCSSRYRRRWRTSFPLTPTSIRSSTTTRSTFWLGW